MKAAAAALSSVLTVIDVCTAASQWVIVQDLMSLMRQNVIQNKADYDTIRHKLEAILSIAQKHWQDGSQQPLDRRGGIGNVCRVMTLHELLFTCPSVLSNVTRIRLNVYRSDG